MSRPKSKNVFYFPHFTKSTIELDLIEHKHKSEGYKAYYRIMELVADADYHRLSVASEDEKIMFELGMNCDKEVLDDVIRILIEKGRIDKKSWEEKNVIWMQDFVETLKPVYVNRRKPLPTKDLVSTSKNTEKRKEKERKINNIVHYESAKNSFLNDSVAVSEILRKHSINFNRLGIETELLILHYYEKQYPIDDFKDVIEKWLLKGKIIFENTMQREYEKEQALDAQMLK
jgi:hypothetical protein